MKYFLIALTIIFTTNLFSQETENQSRLTGPYLYFGPTYMTDGELMFLGPTLEGAYAKNGMFGGIGATWGEYVGSFTGTPTLGGSIVSGQGPKISFYDFYAANILLDEGVGLGFRVDNLFISHNHTGIQAYVGYYSKGGIFNIQLGYKYKFFYQENYMFVRTYANLLCLFKNPNK